MNVIKHKNWDCAHCGESNSMPESDFRNIQPEGSMVELPRCVRCDAISYQVKGEEHPVFTQNALKERSV